MLKKFIVNNLILIFLSLNLSATNNADKLISAYPNFLKEFSDNYVIWNDNEKMLFDDKITNKNYYDLLNKPSLKEQINLKYIKIKENPLYIPQKDEDIGRVRYEAFFKKMYGSTPNEVKKNLVKIQWLPKSINKTLWVTKVNDIDKKLILISQEVEKLPKEIKIFAENIDGAYNWRKISNTNRLSTHSFGIAIDLNPKYSNYWQWDKKYNYKNKIPFEIVEIFEKYGFIWGGRWYHYDTMHFEYRPELLN